MIFAGKQDRATKESEKLKDELYKQIGRLKVELDWAKKLVLTTEQKRQAIYRGPRLSKPGQGHKIYPYLLRDRQITRADEVWSADIAYIRLRGGREGRCLWCSARWGSTYHARLSFGVLRVGTDPPSRAEGRR